MMYSVMTSSVKDVFKWSKLGYNLEKEKQKKIKLKRYFYYIFKSG